LRDDGIAEGTESSHPIGNPMSQPTHVGFNEPLVREGPTARPKRPFTGTVPFATESPVSLWSRAVGVGQRNHDPRSREHIDGLSWFAFAVGVCNNPDSVTEVRGTNGRRRTTLPFRVIPELGQTSENVSHSAPPRQEAWDVLHEDEAGSKLANGSGELGP
jgi:hypothetical protein